MAAAFPVPGRPPLVYAAIALDLDRSLSEFFERNLRRHAQLPMVIEAKEGAA